jgi:DinB family protein
MQGTEAVRAALASTKDIVNWYLGDLSDADLLVRPAPGANHIAWQMGHLILAERGMIAGDLPGTPYPELPAGFVEQHGKDTAAQDPPKGFRTKDEYLSLFNKVRQTSIDALAKLSDADLDKPTTGQMAKFAPKLGNLFLLQANHTMMHGGQFSVVRRKLGKPVLF